jgi:hypothetical protein
LHKFPRRLRNLVVYALGSRYALEAIDTQERGHAVQQHRVRDGLASRG